MSIIWQHITLHNLKLFLEALIYEPPLGVIKRSLVKLLNIYGPSYYEFYDVHNTLLLKCTIIHCLWIEKNVLYVNITTDSENKGLIQFELLSDNKPLHSGFIRNEQPIKYITAGFSSKSSLSLLLLKDQVRHTIKLKPQPRTYYDNLDWDDRIDIVKLLHPGIVAKCMDDKDNFINSDAIVPKVSNLYFDKNEKVTIIIPTKDHFSLLKKCIDSIGYQTISQPYEIIIIDNNSTDSDVLGYFTHLSQENNIRVLKYPYAFNYSAMHNWVMQYVRTEYLLFLNNDVEILTRSWLRQMVLHFQLPEVGAVGCRLLYPDGRIQHDGIYIGTHKGQPIIDHINKNNRLTDRGLYMPSINKYVIGITAACMLTKKGIFVSVDGFNEVVYPISFNDVDYCLNLSAKNILLVSVTNLHHESKSRNNSRTLSDKRKVKNLVRHKTVKKSKFLDNPALQFNLIKES